MFQMKGGGEGVAVGRLKWKERRKIFLYYIPPWWKLIAVACFNSASISRARVTDIPTLRLGAMDERLRQRATYLWTGDTGYIPVSLNCQRPGYLTHRLSAWIWSTEKDMGNIHLHFLGELRTRHELVLIYTFSSSPQSSTTPKRYNNRDVVASHKKQKEDLILDFGVSSSFLPPFLLLLSSLSFLYCISRLFHFCFYPIICESARHKNGVSLRKKGGWCRNNHLSLGLIWDVNSFWGEDVKTWIVQKVVALHC